MRPLKRQPRRRPSGAPRLPVPARATAAQSGNGALRRFVRNEGGNMIIFSLYVMVIVLMFGGIGIDLMHYERDCTELQNTLDRATLAAADLDQPLDPETVVRDYLAKSGATGSLTKVTVDESESHRTVTANATCSMPTQFMQLSGVKSLSAPLISTAEERIDGVEISLVLDVSGSMNSNSKLYNLKVAAKDFVDTMVDNTEDGNLSISVVPYATQVSTPRSFLDKFTISKEQEFSNCVNFDGEDFSSPAIHPEQSLKRTMHFDPWSSRFDGRQSTPERTVTQPVCSEDPSREIMVLEKDRTKLKTYIQNLSAQGNTSIDLGMKWGAALLDPSVKPVISGLIEDGVVSSDFSDRPKPYAAHETLKVIVLMTDGQNTAQYYLPEAFREGYSGASWNPEEKVYSVYDGLDTEDRDGDGITDEPIYYWVELGRWQDHPYGTGTYEATTEICTSYWFGFCIRYDYETSTVTEGGYSVDLSMGDIFAKTTPRSIAENIFAPAIGSSAANSKWLYSGTRDTYVSTTPKNARTRAICAAAKAQGVIVYTIGFEAPTDSRQLLKYCASSDSHYFDVSGLEISDAFSSIASSIRKLRLTQ
ncbi:TadE/TadG family type IV pilus assembly protein [Pseudodonghicola xiamenensis]|uniref:Putative Flp pilus-assembly TadG-like N-terminal domain-containing protein n=2 Tax=Pseudodonghicola xiamenensis TaxID=337702 RepID=A0A8J3MD56_9RHOB|nr:TadE/TadG family type IV pilus assembly protein [Pseudodonghicola xiamenensis]GHG90381.1 hypothetical protein GCM10010961_20620 [Pseudodonghicola xiamenensis]